MRCKTHPLSDFSDKQTGIDLYGKFNDGYLELAFNSDNYKGSLVRDSSGFLELTFLILILILILIVLKKRLSSYQTSSLDLQVRI